MESYMGRMMACTPEMLKIYIVTDREGTKTFNYINSASKIYQIWSQSGSYHSLVLEQHHH